MKGNHTVTLTKDQAAHLNQRILNRHSEIRYRQQDSEPAAVTQARAKVKAWEADQETKSKARKAEIDGAKTHAQEAVLAGDWNTALAAVKKFETTKF